MYSYEVFQKKIEVEFKKLDKSLSFFNYLEKSFFIIIPVEILDESGDLINTYKMQYDSSYCMPDTAFAQKTKQFFIETMQCDGYFSEYHHSISVLKEHVDQWMREDFEANMHTEELEELGIGELDEKNVWVGDPELLYSHYLVIPILIFNNQVMEKYPLSVLYKDEWQRNWDDITYDEIGRRAAARLDKSLFNCINDLHIIASMAYEGAECTGSLVLHHRSDTDQTIDIRLKELIPINEHKRIRKLLETTNENLVLLVDADTLEAYGFKSVSSQLLPINGDIFINFKGWFSWECKRNNEIIFYFEKLQVKFPFDTNNEIVTLTNKLSNEFSLKDYHIKFLISLISEAKKQEKGTMLVLLDPDNAKSEAERLEQSSTLIQPISITSEIIMSFSKIDGALIIDTQGICHSFGVILDGDITNGDPSRGARYNSARRYIETKKEKDIACLIIVVSEDGYVDVLTTKNF